MEDSKDYQFTGNSVPLQLDELKNYVTQLLFQYDKLVKVTDKKPEHNPYTDPIIYTTKEGKTVQIPEDIHNSIVSEYLGKPVEEEVVEEDSCEDDRYTIFYIMLFSVAVLIAYKVYVTSLR